MPDFLPTTSGRTSGLLALLLAGVLGGAPAAAQTGPAQPAAANSATPTAAPRPWYQPHHVLLQTGGGLGMLSAGTGLSLARNRLDLDVLVGYVPRKYAGSALTIAAAKVKYSPWTLPLSSRLALTPLSVGAYLSYTHGTLNDEKPNQYPDDYYWFSTDTRVGPVLGSGLSYALPPTGTGRPRRLTAYYELGTNDLYLISYVQNHRALSLPDIATLSLGLKLDL